MKTIGHPTLTPEMLDQLFAALEQTLNGRFPNMLERIEERLDHVRSSIGALHDFSPDEMALQVGALQDLPSQEMAAHRALPDPAWHEMSAHFELTPSPILESDYLF